MKVIHKYLSRIMIIFLMVASFPQLAIGAAYYAKSDYENLEPRFWNDEAPPIGFYINASARYILETVEQPNVGSTFGEWSVMDLLRAKYTGYDYINYIHENYFEQYYQTVEQYVKERNGILDINKSTEWSRVMLALSALGKDATNVVGYDFIEKLSSSHRFSYRQGINGPIWEIIALNTAGYTLYEDETNADINTIGKMIDYILAREIEQADGTLGGWALTGKNPDPDITGMALQAFAPYYLDEQKYKEVAANMDYEQFATAVERAIYTLTTLQEDNGGYASWGTVNAESTVQVIVALTALQLDPLAPSIALTRLNKTVDFMTDGTYQDGVWSNNMIDALLSFWAPGRGSSDIVGGFKHVTTGYDGGGGSGTSVNAMATDQSLYGLIAYDRFLKGQNSLYDMSDMKNGEHAKMAVKKQTIKYDGNGLTNTTTAAYAPYALTILPWEANVYSWNTKADGSGTKYMPGEKLVMPEHNVTLYAQSEAITEADDIANITKVQQYIDALPNLKDLQREHESEIKRAINAYQKLSANEQAKIVNYSHVITLDGKLKQLLAQFDEELQVTNLVQTIDHLAQIELTVDYELAVLNARRSYNALTASQRLLITNVQKLQQLEAKMTILLQQATHAEKEIVAQQKVKEVNEAIAALPEKVALTLQHEKQIAIVRVSYEALTEDLKQQVKDVEKLHVLEERLLELQKVALEQEQLEQELGQQGYESASFVGTTLKVKAAGNTGDFVVRLPLQLLQSAKEKKVASIEFTDTRGVKVLINGQQLFKVIKTTDKNEYLQLVISQYDYKTDTFSIVFEYGNEAKSTPIVLKEGYMKVTIPYTFFVDGYKLEQKVVVRTEDNQLSTQSYIQRNEGLTLNLKRSSPLKFIEPTISFTDIEKTSTKEEIIYLANRFVIKESSTHQFNPSNDITRAQFAMMVNRALGLQPVGKTAFNDVLGKPYEGDVQALVEAGIIKGTSATTFSPNNKLTRQQAAAIMVRVLSYAQIDLSLYSTPVQYKDQKKMSKEGMTNITILTNLGIMSGSAGNFYPQNTLKRSQMAKILQRTLAIAQLM